MITVKFTIASINYELRRNFSLPALPSLGDQVSLRDYASIEEEEILSESYPQINIDNLFVSHKTWFRDAKANEPYVTIYLDKK